MSKEQTPITAEEFLLQKHGQFVRRSNTQWYELMEQYAQAKVLEALEMELRILWFWDEYEWTDREREIAEENFKEHIETEVKPKYKQIEI